MAVDTAVRGVTQTGKPDPVGLCDEDGVRTGTASNPLPVHVIDVHDNMFNELAHVHVATAVSTLAVATTGDGTEDTITVQAGDGALFTVGQRVQINNGGYEITHPVILSIAADVLTLDRYVDKVHPITVTQVQGITANLNLNGSVTPIITSVAPDGDAVVYCTRMMISMAHATAGDLGKFANLAPLTKGIIVRKKVNGVYSTLTNWKTNLDMKSDMYDVDFDTRSGGGGTFGTSGRWTFINSGATVKLDGALGDELEFIIQDDLSALGEVIIKVQGHYID